MKIGKYIVTGHKHGIKVKYKQTQKDPKALAKLAKRYGNGAHVAVGLPRGGKSTGTAYPDGTPVLAVAFWNEFGTDKIPARSFIRAGGRKASKELKDELIFIMRNVNRGADLKEALDGIGADAVKIIQKYMKDLKTPKNAPYTIMKKKGIDNPLIDTRLLSRSIMWQVRNAEDNK